MANTREKVLELLSRKSKIVDLGNGVAVKVYPMTLDLKTRMYVAQKENDGKELAKLYAEVIINCVVDPETDAPIFLPSDIEMIKRSSSPILDKLLEEIATLSQVDETSVRLVEDELKKTDS